MREAASRGFWMTSYAPYGYRKVYIRDGVKKRPKLELDPPADAVVRRIFDMVLHGNSILDVTKALNKEDEPCNNTTSDRFLPTATTNQQKENSEVGLDYK